jgi:LysR family transcriptional regulator, glycine cleavage system transcriptional activator
LSRRIKLLEAHLGVRLFRRLPRGLGLTEAGAAYFAALAPGWDMVSRATEAALSRSGRRVVKVSVIPTFAANWLVPRLHRFHARHGDVEVELETAADFVDLAARPDLDGALRLGKGPWPGLDSEALLPIDAVPVAAPGFFGDGPAPRQPRDLLQHGLIGSNHQPAFWQEWFAAADIDAAAGRYRRFDNLQLAHEAAAAGMGIALGLDPVVRPYLESGRLVRVLPAPVRLPRHFHIVRRQKDGTAERPFALFRDWLRREAHAFIAAAPAA